MRASTPTREGTLSRHDEQMTLTAPQRDILEELGDFTDDELLQPLYANVLLRRLRDLGEPLSVEDAAQWARERAWPELRVGMLAGVAWAVRYGFDPRYGEPLS